MLATGGSASKAIEQVIEAGASEHRIIFVNLVASQWGLTTLTKRFPGLKVVTAAVDPDLTASKYVSSLTLVPSRRRFIKEHPFRSLTYAFLTA